MKLDKLSNYKSGWMVGNFQPSLIKSKDIEIAIHTLKKGHTSDGHYHKLSTEINCVISGHLVVDKTYRVQDGDIFIYQPDDRTDVRALKDTKLLVIKFPSIADDKWM